MIRFVFLLLLLFRWGVLHRVLLVVGWCQFFYSSGFLCVSSHYLILPRVSSLVVQGLGVCAPTPKAQGLIYVWSKVLEQLITMCRTSHLNNKQNKNANPIISRQDYHLTQPCPSEEKQTKIIPYQTVQNHWTNLKRAETKKKKEFNLEAWEKETSNTIS